MLITAALLILILTVYLLKNFITLQTCKYTFSYSMYYYIINKYPQSCVTVLGLGTVWCDLHYGCVVGQILISRLWVNGFKHQKEFKVNIFCLCPMCFFQCKTLDKFVYNYFLTLPHLHIMIRHLQFICSRAMLNHN